LLETSGAKSKDVIYVRSKYHWTFHFLRPIQKIHKNVNRKITDNNLNIVLYTMQREEVDRLSLWQILRKLCTDRELSLLSVQNSPAARETEFGVFQRIVQPSIGY